MRYADIKSEKIVISAIAAITAVCLHAAPTNIGHAGGDRYATDAYPGFDTEDEIVKPEKKEPRWLGFINGPKMSDPAAQLAYADECLAADSVRKARNEYDALVREWPTAPEAAIAQRKLADIWLVKYLDYEEAFAAYRYLLDFYSSQCDYDAIAAEMFKVAELMRDEGKTVMFFRFANTVDVRRAYEALVLRAPGADFVPGAMLTIASLREDEGKYEEAIKVYENLRNLHPKSKEMKVALYREAKVRMQVLSDHEYNRERCRDTIEFLKSAIARGVLAGDELAEVTGFLRSAEKTMVDEAYRAAKFYDSRTRTRRSAINAYERFLMEFPSSEYAVEVRARLIQLQGEENNQ